MIRALAHPARLAILEYLGGRESATATECAEVVALSPSATSYHLRELAKFGMVDEAPGTDRRERRWRGSPRFHTGKERSDDSDTRAATRLLTQVLLARADQRARDYFDQSDDEPREWWAAATFAETQVRMTADELREVSETITQLLAPYSRSGRPATADSREVNVTFRLFPTSEPPVTA
ncbi:MAG: helix-turn-helix domain-containing protein [Actinocatenispora sp.]